MQPYFFPYLGYFSLIKYSDKWIVFDIVQFIRHGWIERNRILKPNDGWQYISVPLMKHERETIIKNIEIRNSEKWKERILRQLEHYKKIAPYYKNVISFLMFVFSYETDNLSDLNVHLLKETCNYIGISFNYEVYSKMNLEIEPVRKPGDWALNIAKALKATEYINPPGGIELFDKKQFEDAKIKLNFLITNITPYKQGHRIIEAGLSIIDVMMFNTPHKIKTMLDNYKLI